jgi:hypothetical protein
VAVSTLGSAPVGKADNAAAAAPQRQFKRKIMIEENLIFSKNCCNLLYFNVFLEESLRLLFVFEALAFLALLRSQFAQESS